MKRRFVSFFAFSVVTASTVHAQSPQIKAGVNFANITVTNSGSIDENKMLTSFHAGVVVDLPLGTKVISLQPGVLFTGKGVKTEFGDASSNQYYRATSNPYYIEIPVNVVLRVPFGEKSGFFVGAGPYAAIGVAGKNKVEGKSLGISFSSERKIEFSNDDPTTTNFEEGAGFGIMRRFDYGLNVLVGVEGEALVLSAGYGYGLAKLQSGSNSSDNDKNKHRVLGFSVGYKF